MGEIRKMVIKHKTYECEKCGGDDFTKRRVAKRHERMPVGRSLPEGLLFFADFSEKKNDYGIVSEFKGISPINHQRFYHIYGIRTHKEERWEPSEDRPQERIYTLTDSPLSRENILERMDKGVIKLLTNDEVMDFLNFLGERPLVADWLLEMENMKNVLYSKDGSLNNLGKVENIEEFLRKEQAA